VDRASRQRGVVLATIGVNIVANFVSAAFDLSNLSRRRISFKTGGIIAACAALLSHRGTSTTHRR